MTQPTSSASAQTTINAAVDSYRNVALIGGIATGVATLFNPINGAAIGTYTITHIATSVLADMLGWNDAGTIGKIAKFALPYLTATVAALAVLAALGAAIPVTPALIGGLIGATACSALIELWAASRRQSS